MITVWSDVRRDNHEELREKPHNQRDGHLSRGVKRF